MYALQFSCSACRSRRTKLAFQCSIFSTLRKVSRTLGVAFTIEQQMIFVCKHFASICCGYLGAAGHHFEPAPSLHEKYCGISQHHVNEVATLCTLEKLGAILDDTLLKELSKTFIMFCHVIKYLMLDAEMSSM